jgi:hypothetical protein
MPSNGLNALLRPDDSVLVLIDYQPYQLANLNSPVQKSCKMIRAALPVASLRFAKLNQTRVR